MRRNELNGKRLWTLTFVASSDEIRKIRNLLDLEEIRLISERHKALTIRSLFLFIPMMILLISLAIAYVNPTLYYSFMFLGFLKAVREVI